LKGLESLGYYVEHLQQEIERFEKEFGIKPTRFDLDNNYNKANLSEQNDPESAA